MVARNGLVSVTSYFAERTGLQIKARMRRLREVDRRLTESRITEEAINLYVSMLEAKLLPSHNGPAPRRRAVGE